MDMTIVKTVENRQTNPKGLTLHVRSSQSISSYFSENNLPKPEKTPIGEKMRLFTKNRGFSQVDFSLDSIYIDTLVYYLKTIFQYSGCK